MSIQKSVQTVSCLHVIFQPGDFVTFHNLHAMRHKKLTQGNIPMFDLIPTIEFCLHHGNSYGRGLTVLPPGDNYVSALKSRLATIVPPGGNRVDEDGDEAVLAMEVGATDTQELNTQELNYLAMDCDKNINSCKGKTSLNSEPGMSTHATASQGSNLLDDARCMLRTATGTDNTGSRRQDAIDNSGCL